MRKAGLQTRALIAAVRALGARWLERNHLSLRPGARASAAVNSADLNRLFRSALESWHSETGLGGAQSDALARAAAGIAHDLNNLLTVITATSQLASKEAGDAMNNQRWSEVLQASQMAAGLTQQLLGLSRQTMLEAEPISPNSVITGGLELLARLAGDRVAIRTSLAEDAGPIRIDPTELLQVLMNLVLNARDAMQFGGVLTIETRTHRQSPGASDSRELEQGPYVILRVIDTGRGMDEATMSRAFEPHFTTKTTDRGTGLGLGIVSAIVHKAGGRLSVDSRPGAGTTFHLYFPEAREK